MAHKHSEFFMIVFLNILFFFLVSYAFTVLQYDIPLTVKLFGPAILLIIFNGVLMYMFSIPVPFSLTDIHWYSLLLALAMAVPFAGVFIMLKEPFPPYPGVLFAFLDALLVSTAEEVSFRGILYHEAFASYGRRFAFLFQAAFFTLFHFKFTIGFIVAYMVFALTAQWLMSWQRKPNVLYPIVFHTLTNFWMYILFL